VSFIPPLRRRSIDGESAPVKVFDRHDILAATQIINYAASADGKWLMCVGIKAGAVAGTVDGCLQVRGAARARFLMCSLASWVGCPPRAPVAAWLV
jgi:hypothetical protein